MKSLSSQLIITETGEVLRNSVLQYSESGIHYESIFENNHEAAHTLFYDGILSPPVVSLSIRNLSTTEIKQKGFDWLLFSTFINHNCILNENTIIDFETEDLTELTDILVQKKELIAYCGSVEFIKACTVLPLKFLSKVSTDKAPIRWIGTDLLGKKMAGITTISLV